ncbi:hypothetical protein GE061_016776 [Apolygus lucorum]|uniref:Uncharacterized protein n=1 Tax=Apolygus lucorum TaxID=248454 RepID=A0A6A4K0E3_APOLU|nr:hypothetical protein GE061_016776 [Apolygus lucorum]
MKSLRQETTNTEDVSKDGKSPSKDAVSGRGKVVGLFHLPEEVQELILVYLDVRDLVACAQVCRNWRIGINSSWIWKKWCVLESYKPELLEQCPTHLFVDNGEDSVGMGYWRRVYGWHEKLRYNWKTKSLNRYKLSQSTSHVYCFDTNGEVAATGHEDASVTVWSIKSVPFVIASFRGVLHDFPILCVKVDKNLVVVQQRKVLQVFYCAHQKYQLTDLKTFEMGEENIDQMEFYSEHESRFCSWYEECLRAFDKTSAPPTLVFNVFR